MPVVNQAQGRRHPFGAAYPMLAACLCLAMPAPPALAETAAADTREQVSKAPAETTHSGEQGLGEDPKHERPFQEEEEAEDQPALRFPPPDASGQQSYPYLQLNGLIEAAWVHIKPYEGPATSEWLVSTLELGMTFQPHPWVTVQASGLYEDNGLTPLELDVAQLKIGPPAAALKHEPGIPLSAASPGAGVARRCPRRAG